MTGPTLGGASVLDGTVALIAGGTGNVGAAIVRGLLARGATVVVPSRTEAKRAALRDAQEGAARTRLITVAGNVGDEADAERIRAEAVERCGRVDAVVASLGTFVPAPSLLAATRAALERVLADYLLAHFVVARTFIPPMMRDGGGYLFINGPLAFAAMPGSGLVSIATAAQAMLADVVFRETADSAARVNELVLHVGLGWGSPEETERNGLRVASAVADTIMGQSKGQRTRVT
jgi:NAD(P)-dependent dehydrogenase (short-subunit alcohol dehydrogenase family)